MTNEYKHHEDHYLDAFKDHELTVIFQDDPSGIFVVKKPNSSNHCFQIMSGPYGLAITGDCGEFTCFQNKTWKWLRGATGDYLAGKMQVESILCVKTVKELLEELQDVDVKLQIEDELSYICKDEKVDINGANHVYLLELIYDNFGEIPTMYDPEQLGLLNAMSKTFDRLLTEKGL